MMRLNERDQVADIDDKYNDDDDTSFTSVRKRVRKSLNNIKIYLNGDINDEYYILPRKRARVTRGQAAL